MIKLIVAICLSINISCVYATNQTLAIIIQTINDSIITAKITAKYTKDADLNPLKISISTKNGLVTLNGHVNNRQDFIKALRLAKDTQGVQAVEIEYLIIKPVNTSITDAYITAKVEGAILKAKIFDDESIPLVGINVSTENGVVTLSGEVKTDKSIIVIIKYVSKIHGVKKIISKLITAEMKYSHTSAVSRDPNLFNWQIN